MIEHHGPLKKLLFGHWSVAHSAWFLMVAEMKSGAQALPFDV